MLLNNKPSSSPQGPMVVPASPVSVWLRQQQSCEQRVTRMVRLRASSRPSRAADVFLACQRPGRQGNRVRPRQRLRVYAASRSGTWGRDMHRMIPKKYLKRAWEPKAKNMRRRELLGFVYPWLGTCPSSLVIKKGERSKENNMWEACGDGSSRACPLNIFSFFL